MFVAVVEILSGDIPMHIETASTVADVDSPEVLPSHHLPPTVYDEIQ